MKKLMDLFLNNFWFRNSILFVVILLLSMFTQTIEYTLLRIFILCTVCLLIMTWVIIHNRILFDLLLTKKKYLLYVLGLIGGLFLYTYISYYLGCKAKVAQELEPYVFYSIFNTAIGLLLYISFKYYKEQQLFLKNKLYMFELEHKYLKNQLSPHFLFNTLNNIYSYSLIESKKTPELILKLSELMRYLIQFNKHSFITLSEEISFIENYLAFERERLEDRCEITLETKLNNGSEKIEPLLFFPLIENVFKHGTNTIEHCYVYISIEQNDKKLHVTIRNKIYDSVKPSTNLGMENVRKRLHLFYKDRYVLNVQKENDEFAVDLVIELIER